MSAELPYLPPMLQPLAGDIKSIATNTVDAVRAAPTTAAKAGLVARGAIRSGVAVAGAALDAPGALVRNTIGPPIANFTRALVTGEGSPPPILDPGSQQRTSGTLGLPAISQPPATQTPLTPNAVYPPGRSPMDEKVGPEEEAAIRQAMGKSGAASGAQPAAGAPAGLPRIARPSVVIPHGDGVYSVTNNPTDIGAHQQAQYAEAQRQAVLAGAERAAATGHPGNATARYMAALGALPHLSGQNNFATSQSSFAAEQDRTAASERSNANTAATAERGSIRETQQRADAEATRAEQVRRNVIPTIIGEEPNPAGPAFPSLKKYGVVTLDKEGNSVTRHMDGTLVKPPPKTPSVGVSVKEKDGSYPIAGGKTAVVKGGVITEIK